jgi:AraC-like DNA-binding protein
MSAAKFMRMIRLKRAKQLLDNTDYTISEILYLVGFFNPSYFAKCFKQQFGITPTEYKKCFLHRQFYIRDFGNPVELNICIKSIYSNNHRESTFY